MEIIIDDLLSILSLGPQTVHCSVTYKYTYVLLYKLTLVSLVSWSTQLFSQ